MEDVARQEHEEGMFQRGELPGRFTAKKLYEWSDKRYDQEYWGRLERNWKRWKGKRPVRRGTMKTKKKSRKKNWEPENRQRKMKTRWVIWSTHITSCRKNSSRRGSLRGGWCHDLAKSLFNISFSFSFLLVLNIVFLFLFFSFKL